MEPMKPMQPMQPMQPMAPSARWWPEHLGNPASSGGQNRMRYAFFPDDYLLLVEIGDTRCAYDSGTHRIIGVAQQQSRDQTLTFSSETGPIPLEALQKIEFPQ